MSIEFLLVFYWNFAKKHYFCTHILCLMSSATWDGIHKGKIISYDRPTFEIRHIWQ